jgi:spore maturation protein CgeB
MTKTRIMIVGDYMWPWYQEACANALEQLDCEVDRFGWNEDFYFWKKGYSEPFYYSFWHRLQARFHFGPLVWKISKKLLNRIKEFQPDIIWFYNVQLISSTVIKSIRKTMPNAILIQYANDNPFSKKAKSGLWRNFIKSIPLFDLHFSYRHNNRQDYLNHGAKIVHLLRSYFIPDMDYPVSQDQIPEKFNCDVVFAGHYEDDGRVEILEAICNAGFKLNLYGGGWDAALTKLKDDSPLREKYPIKPVTEKNYRFAICGAKVALCFLSTLNGDTYTRRCFQIPAMKTAMLCQYTEDLAKLFEEDKEVVFFRNRLELIEKLRTLIINNSYRMFLAEKGYEKVYKAKHDVKSRMQIFIAQIFEFKKIM